MKSGFRVQNKMADEKKYIDAVCSHPVEGRVNHVQWNPQDSLRELGLESVLAVGGWGCHVVGQA